MGHESDACTARLRGILRIAQDLKEATASDLRSQSSTRTSNSPVVNDSINLPIPRPLLPSLLAAGIGPEV